MSTGLRKQMRRIPWAVVLVAFAGLAMAHEGHDKPSKDRIVVGDVITLSKEARAVLGVRTEDAQSRLLETTLSTIGTVEVRSEGRALASTLLPGVVTNLHVTLGQQVEAGTVLATLRSQELEKLLLDRTTANLELDLAEKELTRTESFARQRIRNQRDLLLAQARRNEMANAVLLTMLKLEALGVAHGENEAVLRIKSPIAGQIARIDVKPGDFVEPSRQIFEVVQPGTQRLRILIPAAQAANVAPNQVVRVAAATTSAAGRIIARAGSLDPQTLTESVWAEFPEHDWLPGKRLPVRIVLSQTPAAISVPESALVRDGMENFVFVQIDPKKFRRTRIVPGRKAGGYVEATSGLLANDPVVTQGAWQMASRFGYGTLKPSKEAKQASQQRVGLPTVERIDHVVELDATVTLTPGDQTTITPLLPGKIVEVLFDLPVNVKEGEPLLRLASVAVQELQLGLLQAELNAQLQRELLAGYAKALQEQPMVVPEQQMQEAQNALQQVQARAASFRRQLLAAGLTAAEIESALRERRITAAITLRAPHAGFVIPGDLALGKVVQPGESLYALQITQGLWVRARVPADLADQLQPGQETRLRIPGRNDVLGVRFQRIDRVATNDNVRFAWVHLPEPPSDLRPGLLGRLTVVLREGPTALALPLGAILSEGSLHQVFVEKDGQFTPRVVTLGARDDLHVAILHGVTAEDRVALKSATDLRRGYGRIK